MSGLMQILLLKVSAHITEQLGMAPGGEFREAFKEVTRTEEEEEVKYSFVLIWFSCCFLNSCWGFFPTQAGRVPFCKFHLGDRPIPVTFKRAIAALSLWQKARLAWGLCFLSDPIRYKLTVVTFLSYHSVVSLSLSISTMTQLLLSLKIAIRRWKFSEAGCSSSLLVYFFVLPKIW